MEFSTTLQRLGWAQLAVLGLICLFVHTAGAATFVIDALEDVGDAAPGDGVCASTLAGGPCTLRAAVQEANALPGADTILIPAFPVKLTLAGADDTAALGDLDLTDDVRIEGTGLTLLDAGSAERVFDVISGTAAISGVRFAAASIRVNEGASGTLRDLKFEGAADTAVENLGAVEMLDDD